MEIFQQIKKRYQLNHLTTGFNALLTIQDEALLRKQLSKNSDTISSIKALYKDNPIFSDIAPDDKANQSLASQFKVIFYSNKYISLFVNKEYEDAFHLSYGWLNTANNDNERTFFLNFALDALGQIKTQYLNENKWLQYHSRFFKVEEHLTQLADKYSSPIKMTTGDFHVSVDYNANRIGIAYLHFLENNIQEAQKLIHLQVEDYGQDIVLQKETHPEQLFWFFNSIEQEKKIQFSQFIQDTLQPVVVQKKSIKLK